VEDDIYKYVDRERERE